MVEYQKFDGDGRRDDIPEEILGYMGEIEEMPSSPANNWMEERGFYPMGDTHKGMGRSVYTHEDTPDVVYKIANNRRDTQNRPEALLYQELKMESWEKEPEETIRKNLAKVIDSDSDRSRSSWLAMERAEGGDIDREDALVLYQRMVDEGFMITDYYPDNVGWVGGRLVLIDYAFMRPIGRINEDMKEFIMQDPRWL